MVAAAAVAAAMTVETGVEGSVVFEVAVPWVLLDQQNLVREALAGGQLDPFSAVKPYASAAFGLAAVCAVIAAAVISA